MSEILQDPSSAALATAIERNTITYYTQLGHLPYGEVYEDAELLWVMTGIPNWNLVLRANLAPSQIASSIERVKAFFRTRHQPVQWYPGPSTAPPDLGQHLSAHGWRYVGAAPMMALDGLTIHEEQAIPDDIQITSVSDQEGLQSWFDTFLRTHPADDLGKTIGWDARFHLGMGRDACWHYYLAWRNGEPIATSILVASAGVAGIHQVSTVPEARKQGIGTAITLATIREARSLGYHFIVLESTEMSHSLYQRMGFRECFSWPIYFWSPDEG